MNTMLRLSLPGQEIMSFILNGIFRGCIRERIPAAGVKYSSLRGWVLAGCWLLAPLALAQDKVETTLEAAAAANQEAAAAQQRIDTLATDTRSMLEEYRQVVARSEDLKAYNDQVERMLKTQSGELAALAEQTRPNAVTKEKLLPLLQKMVDTLGQFVKMDTPFLAEERATRVRELENLIDMPDVGMSEKYRRVMEAYQVEAEYGRTIEAYSGSLPAAGGAKGRTVNFLRVGRMGLYYATLDGGESGYWDGAAKTFKPLPSAFNREIDHGLKIARKESAPDLLKVPLPAPEVIQ